MTTAPPLRVPRYDELPVVGQTGDRHAWDVFGRDDELGCLNHIGSAQVVGAAREVCLGRTVNLNLPVGEPQPQFWANRPAVQHHSVVKRNIRDDYLDSFQMQGSTQWDGLRHQRYREFGWFGGRQEDAIDSRGELSIGRWAERGIIARGVLADVAGYRAAAGEPVAPAERLAITGALISEVLAAQETDLRSGDILLVRTGWLGWYRALDADERVALADRLRADPSLIALPGLDPRRETIGWLWDHRIAAIAFDNPTVEALPYRPDEGWAHTRLLPLLGLPLGELWLLDELAQVCAAERRYSFLLSASPLNLIGGAGSPANAYAVL